jgi:hypothetical protein
MTSTIKLYQLGNESNGVKRFQSQLYVGGKTADFIQEDGVMKCWGRGEKGFNFYPYNEPFVIAQSKQEMNTQTL